MSPRSFAFTVLPCLALACSNADTPSESSTQAAKKDDEAASDEAAIDKAASDKAASDKAASDEAASDKAVSDAKPSEPAPSVEPTPTPSGDPNTTFQLAALREGPLQLAVVRGDAMLLASGQPIPIDAQGVARPDPALAKGLTPRLATYGYMFETLAFGGSPAGEAWVTTRQEHDRAATEYDVHVLRGGRWQRHAIEKGPIVEYYSAYVELGGAGDAAALLGLRAYATNPLEDTFEFEDEGDEAAAFARKREAAFAKAKHGFVHLAGEAPAAMPRLPAKLVAFAAVTSEDGTLYALAQPSGEPVEPGDAGPGDATLLVWPPGKAEAEQVALSGFGDRPALAASGALALIGGREQIAIVRGSALEMIDRKGLTEELVGSLAASPAGDVWVVLGDHPYMGEGDDESMWFRKAGASTPSWTKVELPLPQGPLATPGERRAWDMQDEGWVLRDRDAITERPMPSRVVYAKGAAWVVADLGAVWESSISIVRRSGVYTTLAGPREVVELEPADLMQVRQYAALGEGKQPGDEQCPYAELVLGDAADEAAIMAKLEEGGLMARDVFIGEIEGKRERVMPLTLSSRETLATLPTLLAGLADVTIDCRPHTFVESAVGSE